MIEYHDHSGDEHDDVPPPDANAPDDHGADPHPPPLEDLDRAHAAPPPELHFPGDEPVATAPGEHADPGAPWPDDGDFARWLADEHAPDAPDPGDDGVADALAPPPDGSAAMPSADDLVDWTLRRLSDG